MSQRPSYLLQAVSNPPQNRAPWYTNTAPSYAGVFLWIVFYQSIGENTISHAGLGVCFAALMIAAVLCYVLYYFAPAMLGMKTGYPLYVIASSTFGTIGAYAVPGLLMGLLQIGWFSVATFIATDFILKGFGLAAGPGSTTFVIVGVVWGYIMAYVGVRGIQYVGKVSLLLNSIPLVMLIVVFWKTAAGIAHYAPTPAKVDTHGAFVAMLGIVLGFFAIGGAAGADFGMNSRNAKDVRWGGLVGISLAAVVAGGLALLSVAGRARSSPFSNRISIRRRCKGHRWPSRDGDVFPLCSGLNSGHLLLFPPHWQQLVYDDSASFAPSLNYDRGHHRYHSGCHRRSRQSNWLLRNRRCFVQSHLRLDRRRLLVERS
ncbi:MAG: hypothetical protein ABI380_15325 [Edaphobacter sp.]